MLAYPRYYSNGDSIILFPLMQMAFDYFLLY